MGYAISMTLPAQLLSRVRWLLRLLRDQSCLLPVAIPSSYPWKTGLPVLYVAAAMSFYWLDVAMMSLYQLYARKQQKRESMTLFGAYLPALRQLSTRQYLSNALVMCSFFHLV